VADSGKAYDEDGDHDDYQPSDQHAPDPAPDLPDGARRFGASAGAGSSIYFRFVFALPAAQAARAAQAALRSFPS
jgi:hypothetical protein